MTESAADGASAGSGASEGGAGAEEIPYQHDQAFAEVAARLADFAYAAAPRRWDVPDHLRAQTTGLGLDPETPLVRELVLAACYDLRLDHGGKAGCTLRPRTETEVFAWPPRIAEVPADVVALWRDVADRATHPAARARFNDLLFERRDGVGRDRAVAAGTAYLEAARSHPRADLDVAAFLIRAWDLARRVGAWALLADSCSELSKRADAEMSSGPAAPGVVLPMLAAVAAKPTRSQVKQAPESILDPVAVGRLLDTALVTFKDGYLASQIASLMRGRTDDPAEIEKIDRREVAAYLDEADASSGMAKQSHLQNAINISRARGLTDLARQATAQLQAIPVKDLGLKRSSSSIRVPRDQVERFLDGFTASIDWRDGLGFFIRTGCPLGELARLRQEERDIAKVTVFGSLVARTILGADGLPRWTATSADDRQAARLATCARIRAENQGHILAEGLQRMARRYGTPGESDLATFLSRNGQTDQSLALTLARGLRHYWAGDYEASVHVVVPKIEAAARALLRELDEGIYRLQVAKDPGQYPGLYVLLHELEELALDESWAYFLRWLFLGPLGMNIRNEVAHGFVTGISPVYAALTLRAGALLITVVAPQPPSAVRTASHENDHAIDLAELPHRDRDEIRQILSAPVRDPVPLPWRGGPVGRLAGLTAPALRTTASALNLLARRLDRSCRSSL
jgi:Domain of unknown function (DUF4209)